MRSFDHRSARRAVLGATLAASLAASLVLAAAPVFAADTAVTIAGFAFGPSSVTVQVGDSVTWTNEDAAPHTATAGGSSFDTGTIGNGASASVTFATAGTYAYICEFHPTMTGTVVVAGVSTDPPSITPAPTDTVPTADLPADTTFGTLAAILATLGGGMLIGTALAGRRVRAPRD